MIYLDFVGIVWLLSLRLSTNQNSLWLSVLHKLIDPHEV